jgi:hypothetical protein
MEGGNKDSEPKSITDYIQPTYAEDLAALSGKIENVLVKLKN